MRIRVPRWDWRDRRARRWDPPELLEETVHKLVAPPEVYTKCRYGRQLSEPLHRDLANDVPFDFVQARIGSDRIRSERI